MSIILFSPGKKSSFKKRDFNVPVPKGGGIKTFNNPKAALFSLFAGALMISFSGVWVEICQITPTASAFYRVLFGGVILAGLAAINSEIQWHGVKHILIALPCALFFALDLVFYHASIQYVGPGLGTILPNFQVFILAGVGVVLLKEKLTLPFIFSIPVAIAGLWMIVGVNWSDLENLYKVGLMMGLSAAFFYACFLLLLKKLQSSLDASCFFYGVMLVSLFTALILSLEIIRSGDTFHIPNIQSFGALAALGLFSQSFGWMLIANALPHIRTSLSGLVLLVQPAMAFVWDVALFQRPTELINWIGVFITLSAIYTATTGAAKPAE